MHLSLLIVGQPHCRELLASDALLLTLGQLHLAQAKKHIAKHIQPRKKRKLLKHDSALATGSIDRQAILQHLTVVRRFKPGYDVE